LRFDKLPAKILLNGSRREKIEIGKKSLRDDFGRFINKYAKGSFIGLCCQIGLIYCEIS